MSKSIQLIYLAIILQCLSRGNSNIFLLTLNFLTDVFGDVCVSPEIRTETEINGDMMANNFTKTVSNHTINDYYLLSFTSEYEPYQVKFEIFSNNQSANYSVVFNTRAPACPTEDPSTYEWRREAINGKLSFTVAVGSFWSHYVWAYGVINDGSLLNYTISFSLGKKYLGKFFNLLRKYQQS